MISYISDILIFFSNNELDVVALSFVTIKAGNCSYASKRFNSYIALAYSGGTPSRGGGPRNVANISLGMVI